MMTRVLTIPVTMMSLSPSRSIEIKRKLSSYKTRISKMETQLFENCESICKLYAKNNYICYSEDCFELHNDIKELFWKVLDLEDELKKHETGEEDIP
jgi:hypothetical protein